MSAAIQTATEFVSGREAARARKRADVAAKKERAAIARTEFDRLHGIEVERQAEVLATSSNRLAVTDYAGNVVRGPRVERDGISFVRSSPIKHLVARWKSKQEDGRRPLITERHERACNRLCLAWEEGGQGIGMGASDYERMSQSRGSGNPDFSPKLLSQIHHQRQQRAVFEGAKAWMGSLWPIIQRIVVEGADLSVWASEADTPRNAAPGYLAAALDRLAEFFSKMDAGKAGKRKPQPIRTIEFVHPDAHLIIENVA